MLFLGLNLVVDFWFLSKVSSVISEHIVIPRRVDDVRLFPLLEGKGVVDERLLGVLNAQAVDAHRRRLRVNVTALLFLFLRGVDAVRDGVVKHCFILGFPLLLGELLEYFFVAVVGLVNDVTGLEHGLSLFELLYVESLNVFEGHQLVLKQLIHCHVSPCERT